MIPKWLQGTGISINAEGVELKGWGNEELCDGKSLSAIEKFDILRIHWTLVSNSIQVETFKKGK